MYKERIIGNSVDHRAYRSFYVCNDKGECNKRNNIYFLCLSPNCNQEFRNDHLQERNSHKCGMEKRITHNKQFLPNVSPSHTLSISPPFTFPLPNGKSAVIYDLKWILFVYYLPKLDTPNSLEQKNYQLSLLSSRSPDPLPEIVYEWV